MSLEEIEESLKGDREHQLRAVDALHGMNLRSCLDLVRAYLETDPDPLASALLIDSLIDQQISEELTLNRDGIGYTFIPRYQEGAAGKRRLSFGPRVDRRMAGKRKPFLI